MTEKKEAAGATSTPTAMTTAKVSNFPGTSKEIAADFSRWAAWCTQLSPAAGYKRRIFDQAEETAEPRYLFSIGNVPTIPAGELIGIKGRAKQGKSQFLYLLIGAMLAGIDKGSIRPIEGVSKVLLFDTEQSKASLKKCVGRALKFAGLPTDRSDTHLTVFYLRPDSIEERRKTIDEAVTAEQPDIIFIDGVRDLVQDFNDLKQSSDLIQWLLKLTAENGCTIVCVLHQNKSRDDSNMRGHLGTELLNKLTDCFEVGKKDGRFVATCTDSRNVPCGDVSFAIDENGEFKIATEEDKVMDMRAKFGLLFKNATEYTYSDLCEAYGKQAGVETRTAQDVVGEASRLGILAKERKGRNSYYSLATDSDFRGINFNACDDEDL